MIEMRVWQIAAIDFDLVRQEHETAMDIPPRTGFAVKETAMDMAEELIRQRFADLTADGQLTDEDVTDWADFNQFTWNKEEDRYEFFVEVINIWVYVYPVSLYFG